MCARFLLPLFLFISTVLHAQTDSLRLHDSVGKKIVSLPQSTSFVKSDLQTVTRKISLTWQQDTAFNRFFINKKLPENKQFVYAINAVRQPTHEDEQFYILAGLLLFTGIVRSLFPKYFTTLFQLFFQSSYRQRQSKENIAQDTLPSFLMNLVFIFSSGLLLASFIKGDDISYHIAFPLLWLYTCTALSVIYIAKSFFIVFFGWLFDVQETASNYQFIVFLVNKIAGLWFIPLLLILVYSTGAGFNIISAVTITIILILLLYRYIVSLSVVGKKLKIHPLHFFLYLCAVEILPLLITYKLLLITKEI